MIFCPMTGVSMEKGKKMSDDLISRISLRQSIVTSMIMEDEKTLDQIIDEEPTIEAEPVKHAKWINHRNDDGHNIADCSECGSTIQWFGYDEKPMYCCMCGARMDERKEL